MQSMILIGVLLVFIAAGGSFVQRVSGFGLAIFVMLFLPYLLGSNTMAAAVSNLFACVITTYNAIKYRRHFSWKIGLPLIIAAAVTIPIAVYFSAYAPERLMKILLGVVLVLLSVYFMFFGKKLHIRASVGAGVGSGALGGILNGLFSISGPPAVFYLMHATEDKQVYFAVIQMYFALTNIYAVIFRATSGIITTPVLIYAAIGLVGCLVGDWLGSRVFDKLDGEKLKKLIYIGMVISGVLMVIGL